MIRPRRGGAPVGDKISSWSPGRPGVVAADIAHRSFRSRRSNSSDGCGASALVPGWLSGKHGARQGRRAGSADVLSALAQGQYPAGLRGLFRMPASSGGGRVPLMASDGGRAPRGPLAASDARVGPAQLRRRCDRAALGFATTDELAPLVGRIGQDRAAAAIEFALDVRGRGYNLLVMGPPGTGRRTAVQALLSEHAAGRPAPADWVYLFNFAEPVRPIAVALPGPSSTRCSPAWAASRCAKASPSPARSTSTGRSRRSAP
jgi:hypothetical protein